MGNLAIKIYDDLIGRRGSSHDTAKHWMTWTERFEEVCGIKDKYTRDDVVKFLAWERDQGFSENSIRTHLRPIKLLAQIQGWEFPRLTFRRVRPQEITRTIFTRDQVISLIQLGPRLLEPKELAWLAVSTTYGVRREEMARPLPPEISDGHITIHTVKGGPVTRHLIPPEISPYLEGYKAYSTDYMTQLFRRILEKTGIKVGAGYGWHSIRRALATELLLSEVSALNITRFMRWSDATLIREFGMLALYAKKDQSRVDEQIFRVHPFLPYWSSGKTREPQRRSKLQQLIDLLESRDLAEPELDKLLKSLKRG
jgi:hypothetical protein